jgi:hypothetical protein
MEIKYNNVNPWVCPSSADNFRLGKRTTEKKICKAAIYCHVQEGTHEENNGF